MSSKVFGERAAGLECFPSHVSVRFSFKEAYDGTLTATERLPNAFQHKGYVSLCEDACEHLQQAANALQVSVQFPPEERPGCGEMTLSCHP